MNEQVTPEIVVAILKEKGTVVTYEEAGKILELMFMLAKVALEQNNLQSPDLKTVFNHHNVS